MNNFARLRCHIIRQKVKQEIHAHNYHEHYKHNGTGWRINTKTSVMMPIAQPKNSPQYQQNYARNQIKTCQ